MVPSKISDNERNQGDLFRVMLRDVVDPKHPMVILANSINWEVIEKNIEPLFCSNNGRPCLPIRMIVALLYLKNAYDLSDGLLLNTWLENPYWQFFTGGVYFEHKVPFDSSNMSNWRKRIGEDGLETLLKEILSTAVRLGFIKLTEFKKVNIDTTVQEKNIRFPTDARLYDRLREKLVKEAKRMNIELRQSYEVVSRKCLHRQSSYAHANQFKKARKQTKKLKVYLGRVTRDIRRKMHNSTPLMDKLLGLSDRLLAQKKDSKNKLYSIHETEVECISKGKAHKKYEFGCKVGFVTTAFSNWIIGAKAFHGNPYDGHTLKDNLEQAKRITGIELEQGTCDLGYRQHNYEGPGTIHLVNRLRKKIPRAIRKLWKRRSAIEPVIGHLKQDNRLNCNRLKGKLGDKLNAILSACGFNFRKLLRAIALFFVFILKMAFFANETEEKHAERLTFSHQKAYNF